MKTAATYPDQFRKPSGKTPEQIRLALEKIESEANPEYIVKHNGRHIWIEMPEKKQEVWSPLLHLEVEQKNDSIYLNGQYVENRALWVALLIARIVVFTAFFVSLASAAYKIYLEEVANTEIMVMFAMASCWFGLYLLGKWNRRLSSKQAAELRAFMDNIA